MPTRFLLIAALCLLAACTSTPPEKMPTGAATHEQIEALLARAERTSSPQREQLRLQAAELLLEQQQLDATANTLQSIEPAGLDLELYMWWVQLRSSLELALGQADTALARLEEASRLPEADQITLERQLALGLLRARALALVGQHFASAEQRVYLDPLLPESHREPNQDALWQSLMALQPAQLQQYHDQASNSDLQGWLALALLARDTQLGLQSQSDLLDQWLAAWPRHPAASHLPDSLRLIRSMAARQPTQVALLLPTSGRLQAFGRAVRDGFMAAWYEQAGQRPVVRTYDTASGDIIAIYAAAVAEGAELVIGPLDKQQVGELQRHDDLPVPVLALNRSEMAGPVPEHFYQFSLAPEDEARLLADAAAQKLYRRALILAPADDSSQRVVATFAERWRSLGGEVVGHVTLTGPEDYSARVTEALHLNLSTARAEALERTIGRSVRFAPRRRQDVDFVLLLAQPQAARSLKPLLAYHYAGDLPVLATSRIYEGYPQPMLDRDLNGIVFSDIPWLFTPEEPLYHAITSTLPKHRGYLRLYALGIDSFRLYPRLAQLEQLPDSRLYGRTGNLKLNSRREVERELSLARFVQGRPRPVPLPDHRQLVHLPVDSITAQTDLMDEGQDQSSHSTGMDAGHATQPVLR